MIHMSSFLAHSFILILVIGFIIKYCEDRKYLYLVVYIFCISFLNLKFSELKYNKQLCIYKNKVLHEIAVIVKSIRCSLCFQSQFNTNGCGRECVQRQQYTHMHTGILIQQKERKYTQIADCCVNEHGFKTEECMDWIACLIVKQQYIVILLVCSNAVYSWFLFCSNIQTVTFLKTVCSMFVRVCSCACVYEFLCVCVCACV